MAKKITDETPLQRFEDDWGGTYSSGQNAGKEWGKTRGEVERVIKEKVATMEQNIDGKVGGVIVNNSEVSKDANGKVNITIPTVSNDVTNASNPNAAQAGAVAQHINSINSNMIADIQLGETSQDGTMVELLFFNANGDRLDDLTVMIPAAQDVGEIIQPVITTELLTSARIKLGDSISLRWGYDCLRKFEGSSERVNYPAQTVAVTVKIGTTTVYTETHAQVAVGTLNTLTLSPDIINQAGTVSISVVATTPIDEETKTSRGSKSVTVITMDLATTFDPASQLALSNGYTDAAGQIAIPYTYTVPTGTILKVWVDGVLDATENISGTGRNYIYLTASNLSAGRHNVQLIADSAGLLSNAVSVDVLKAGGDTPYLGLRLNTDVSSISSMPLPYDYGSTPLALAVNQFEELQLDLAAWNNASLNSTIYVAVDGVTTQTLSADRTLQTMSQRFDTAGTHTMTITNGTVVRTFSVVVSAASGVTETETVGYRTKLTATGRSNSEANPADWGGITSFQGVDWRTNGWNRGSDGVDSLLLTNGAKAVIDVKPFVQDMTDGDYSIQNRGMTLEMEIMVSQVMERGATIIQSLCDNNNDGYPMGIRITTEEAGLYFGGVEEITTAEDLVDENGNYIDYEGNIVDEANKVPLKITRPHSTAMNIAIDKWIHLAFVVQPVVDGYGLAMLFINGVLSRANRYTTSLRQNTPAPITIDSDKADVRIRSLRYYRTPLSADEAVGNWIIDRPTAQQIQNCHQRNAVGDSNNTTDSDGNIAINHDTLLNRGRGILTIIRSTDTIADGAAAGSGTGLSQMFRCKDKKENFKADLVKWEPPLDGNGNPIGDGFEARNIRMRIQGTSSVKYPYKNLRIYLTTQQGDAARSLAIGGVDVTDSAGGYPLRGAGNSIEQAVICAKTDFVDSSLVMNTGGAHLFNNIMHQLNLDTPPQQYDARVRQAIDGLPCDVYAGTSENGQLTYCGQFVLNNEKSKSSKIFGMEGVKDANGNEVGYGGFGGTGAQFSANETSKWHFAYKSGDQYIRLWNSTNNQWGNAIQLGDAAQCGFSVSNSQIAQTNGHPNDTTTWSNTPPSTTSSKPFLWLKRTESGTSTYYHITGPLTFALEALNNASPMTLFQPAGSANSDALADQLAAEFDNGFEFNHPEDAKWANVDEGQWDNSKNKWSVKPLPGARAAVRRFMGWIYDCVPSAMRTNPDYGTQAGWSDASKQKWVSTKFKNEIAQYFDLNHLLTYYLFTDYWASVDQRAKNIIWRTWDGLKWYSTYYDGDTAMSIRNDAFMVYLYNVTRDTYDSERAKYAFEGHNSWLWCLVLANFEDELKQCAANLRNQLTTEVMLNEFNNIMQGNWSERQYNKSGKLKYIDTINDLNYVYTLTGNRELHRTQFITDRARLLDARYGSGNYNGDVITFTVVRNSSDTPSALTLKSGDLYYFGYKLNGLWLQGPSRAAAGESLTLNFTQTLATNDPLMLGGASCIKELDFTGMGSQLNGTVGLSLCTMLSKLVMPATNGAANAPLTLGDTAKLEYVDITGQTAVNTGTVGMFDISKHTRLSTFLAGGTTLTNIKLPEGSPLETLVMPSTLQTLTLRYLPKLKHSGLILQGTSNITALNFAECPNLSWQTLMQQCPNIDHIRIEGMSGRVRSSMLRPFMNGFRGLTATGTEQTYPALIGKVQLLDVVDDFETMQSFFALCGLELEQCQYTEYVFDDTETDPANITNEDNQTGYAYRVEGQEYGVETPNGYTRSGHVKVIHDKCVPVMGLVKNVTENGQNKRYMHITPLSKENYTLFADGTSAANAITDNEGIGQDAFLYVPKYFYKGVNNYMSAKKHLFLSGLTTVPSSSFTNMRLVQIPAMTKFAGQCLDISGSWLDLAVQGELGVGNPVLNWIGTASLYNTYRVDVSGGFKQVRFPGLRHNYAGFAFADADGKCISAQSFTMTDVAGNPADFDNEIGDYIFVNVPDNAAYLYFSMIATNEAKFVNGSAFGAMPVTNQQGTVTGYAAVLLTDSTEIEAIEPNWVEHKPELIGLYQGFAEGITTGGTPTSGLRSLSGKNTSRGNGTSTINAWTYDSDGNPTDYPSDSINGTAQDFYNLARIRTSQTTVDDGEYTTVPYETSKDMANLMMAWFGTRDCETICGNGSTSSYTTGLRNSRGMGDTRISGGSSSNTTGLNKMWGLEAWTASMYEWMDNGCLNAPSFDTFYKEHRVEQSNWVVDYQLNIKQQDGNERRVKMATTNQASNVARVRFGRFCDIVASAYAGDSVYATCYACYQSANSGKGRVLGRSGSYALAFAGVACAYTNYAASYSSAYGGGRLCFFGKIENEEDVL